MKKNGEDKFGDHDNLPNDMTIKEPLKMEHCGAAT
jgi:hypothetical protein